jgi:hypothetical protein
MDSNGRPLKNSFTTKINVNNNSIEGVKDVILNNIPITETIEDFKQQDTNILSRLEILETNSNIHLTRISQLELQNFKLKQIIYNLLNIMY